MRRFVLPVILIALAAGCSSAHHVSAPAAPGPAVPDTVPVDRGPRLRVTVSSGCPHTIGAYQDVDNVADPQSRHTLVPIATATAALVCDYGQAGLLTAGHTLDATDAASLATVIAQIDPTPDTGVHGCVADIGLFNIVVLSYRSHADVDLWWHASGCQTLDNGVIVAFQINSPSFAAFEQEIGRR